MLGIESFITNLSTTSVFFVYLILSFIIFAETGLMLGFFLPGDSILFAAGVMASRGSIHIYLLCFLLFVAATLGNSVGYWFGQKMGKKLFRKENSWLFHKDHLRRSHEFYQKHGGKTILIARFIPIIRTFAPIVAGIADMEFGQFTLYNIIGALLWAVAIPFFGYYLGSVIPNIDAYLLPVIGLIIFISVAPGLYQVLKTKEQRQSLYALLSLFVNKILAK